MSWMWPKLEKKGQLEQQFLRNSYVQVIRHKEWLIKKWGDC
jgi:hypothetical protein